MKVIARLMIAMMVLVSVRVPADDVEIYFTAGAESTPYVLLMLDLRSSTFSTVANSYTAFQVYDGTGTQTPVNTVLTQEAYDKLIEYGTYDPNDGTGDDKVTVFELFRAVMAGVLDKQDPPGTYTFDGIQMALEVSNNVQGSTILEGYKLLGGVPDGREALLDALAAMPKDLDTGKKTHEFGGKESYWEWFQYLNGYGVEFGMATGPGQGGKPGNFDGTEMPPFDPDIIADPNDPNPNNPSTNYISPFDADSCPALYSIVVAMQGPPDGQDKTFNTVIDTQFGSNTSKTMASMMEEMHTSTTDVVPSLPNVVVPMLKSWVISDSGSIAQTKKMAEAGGTDLLYVDDPVALSADLEKLFGEVLSVSSSFVAASVPVNVFNQTESLDNLFVALFEARNTIAWPGNVKKLKLADDPNDGDNVFDEVVDAEGGPGFETTGINRGRIYYDALTFWTDKVNLAALDANTPTDPNDNEFIPPGADGRVVDRGAAGQKIPGFVTSYPYAIGDSNSDNISGKAIRKVFVEDPNATNGLSDFHTGLASNASYQAFLGTTDPNEAEALIKYGRGKDVDSETDPNAPREWILADAIHSQPFALNYGATGSGYDPNNPDIKLLFGTGDGMFHVIENTDASSNETGTEIFGYFPREVLGQLKRRRSGDLIDKGTDMRYGIDGAPVVFTEDVNDDGNFIATDNDEVYVYFGLRRGGYSYHALDIVKASEPKLIWKITETRSDGSSTAFEELGLTFSTPTVSKVKYDGNDVDVLVFGGGYHGGWDPNDPNAATQFGKDVNADDDAFGNAIYIVNARTGALIWKANYKDGLTTGGGYNISEGYPYYNHKDMVDSIPSDVTLLETDGGYLHRIYVGDTGGAVWRADVPPGECTADPPCSDANADWRVESWFVSKLADFTPTAADDLRFFHKPDVVETKLADGTFVDGVVIQTGNRADPLDKRFSAADNYLYYIRDFEVNSGADTVINYVDPNSPSVASEIPQYTASDLSDRTSCIGSYTEVNATTCEPLVNAGWKIKLPTTGEKGLSTPLIDAGRVFSTSYIPGAEGVCGQSPEGNGRLYVVSLASGDAVSNQRSYELGPGIPSGAVLIGDAIWIPGGGIPEDLDLDGTDDGVLTESLTERLVPIYWREPGIDDI
jgi:type IV pilus assembly protein PilY1